MKITTIIYAFLLLLPNMSHAGNPQFHTLVTLPPLSGLVLALQPTLNVQCLLPNNADPHHFQLTPKQVDSLQQAQLLIRSPQDDQSWAMLDSNTPTFNLWQEHDKAPQTHHHHHATHAWLNPKLVMDELPHLEEALLQANPTHEQNIQTQLKRSQQQAQHIWQQWELLVQQQNLKQRGIMMQHPSWQGLFEALGVPIRSVLESAQHGQEYGPRKLEKALHVLKKYPQTVLIADSNHSNRALTWLQKRTGNTMIALDALGQCGESWSSLMQRNIEALNKLTDKQP